MVNFDNSIVEEKKTIAARDAHLAADALREANKAQGNAEEATRKVIQAKIELDDILRIITTVEEPGIYSLGIISTELSFLLQNPDFWMI